MSAAPSITKRARSVARRIRDGVRGRLVKIDSARDGSYLHADVPLANLVSHANRIDYLLKAGNKPGMRVLELGSREVTGASSLRSQLTLAEYVGFDYYAGPNVDVVGDAHRLCDYFPGQKFDIIYSSAVFEHLAMPWLVAPQIARLLRVGGLVIVETHFSFSSHERPWHFFQFSDMALRVLFPAALGIECIEAGVSNPMVGRFSSLADPYLRLRPISGLYCHSDFVGRKTREVETFDWVDVDVDELVSGTKYPAPSEP